MMNREEKVWPVLFIATFENRVKNYIAYFNVGKKVVADLKGIPTSVYSSNNENVTFKLMIPIHWLGEESLYKGFELMMGDLKKWFNKAISSMPFPLNNNRIVSMKLKIPTHRLLKP